MSRLDTQRRPSKLHARTNARYYVRGYNTTPHDPWGNSYAGTGGTITATSGFAGTPGDFGPVGCTLPATAAAVIASSITAIPATDWEEGQYVQTATAGAPGRVHWDGEAWVAGAHP